MPTPAAGLATARAADATTPSVLLGARLGLCCDLMRDPLSWDHVANYLTVISHRDIGSPFRPTYRHITRLSGTRKGVVPLADSPKSDDGEKASE